MRYGARDVDNFRGGLDTTPSFKQRGCSVRRRVQRGERSGTGGPAIESVVDARVAKRGIGNIAFAERPI